MSDSKGAAELAELIGAFSHCNPAKAKRLKALLAQEVNKARIDEWEKMVEFMKPPEMHPDFSWPCKFCGLAPLMFDNERLKELKRKAGLV